MAALVGGCKIDPAASERVVPPEETLAHAACIARAKGVTRLADITGLDKLGIPVHSAIVPRSDDRLSVYNGKGASALESRVSALMEAIERQTALYADIPVRFASHSDLGASGSPVCNPEAFNHALKDDYSDAKAYEWVQGHDLIGDEDVLVPAGLVLYGPHVADDGSPYQLNSTNGLASGNCMAEAICHGLCELLERDAWTMAELASKWIPRARRERMFGDAAGAYEIDNPDICPRIDLSDADPSITCLADRFANAGLQLVVRDITGEFGIASAIASVAEDSIPGFPQAHAGMGAHPNARIAVTRAVTELAQSRAVDIQGVREDLTGADEVVSAPNRRLQRAQSIDSHFWMLNESGKTRSYHEIPCIENQHVEDDIDLILARLKAGGIKRAIVVNLSERGGHFSVVRVLVPGLEFWALDEGRLGPRAVRFWRDHV